MQLVAIPNITCVNTMDVSDRIANVKFWLNYGAPRLQILPVIQSEPLAIVAGGPSLKKTYKRLKKFRQIATCGSAHDCAISLGIKATYHIEADPQQLKEFYQLDNPDCTYLLASRIDPWFAERLSRNKKLIWNLNESDIPLSHYSGEIQFRAGCTCTLAMTSLAMGLGFKDIHYFGFDSSFAKQEEHHAYDTPQYDRVITTRAGDKDTGRDFLTTPSWLAQAQQFHQIQAEWSHAFTATVHGDSLICEMQKSIGKGYKA